MEYDNKEAVEMKLKRCMAVLLAAAMSIFSLTGCAENQIPDLTDEQMQQIGEFVAVTMMKYDAGHRSRLMDLPEMGEMEEIEPVPEAPVGMAPVDDTPVVDSTGMEVTEEAEAEEPVYSMEEVMGLPEGVNVAFADWEICDDYPGDSDVFNVSAGEGKKLFVLRFSITNAAQQEQEVDLLSSGTAYRITVNGEYSRRALTTMLLDDMSSYQGTLPAGENAEAVLIIEVEEALGAVASLSLDVKNGEKTHTVELVAEKTE